MAQTAKMSKQQLLEELTESRMAETAGTEPLKEGDPLIYEEEKAHKRADKLLLDYIADEDICAAFEALPKWYA